MCFSVIVFAVKASAIVISMNETIRDWSLFFGAFTTMINSWLIPGPILRVIYFYNSFETGFSTNQQLYSPSEFIILHPSS